MPESRHKTFYFANCSLFSTLWESDFSTSNINNSERDGFRWEQREGKNPAGFRHEKLSMPINNVLLRPENEFSWSALAPFSRCCLAGAKSSCTSTTVLSWSTGGEMGGIGKVPRYWAHFYWNTSNDLLAEKSGERNSIIFRIDSCGCAALFCCYSRLDELSFFHVRRYSMCRFTGQRFHSLTCCSYNDDNEDGMGEQKQFFLSFLYTRDGSERWYILSRDLLMSKN